MTQYWSTLVIFVVVAIGVLLAWRDLVRERFERAHAQRRRMDADGNVLGADPVHLVGTSGAAVLLLHGFNDTPQSMAYLATRLHAEGYTVLAPRLPGHGVSLRRMAREARDDAWRRAVSEAYDTLRARYATVFVCGQSMGGALAVLQVTELATPGDVPAVALLAPYLGMPSALQWRSLAATFMQLFSAYHTSSGGERSIHDDAERAKVLGPGIVTAAMLRSLRRVALAAERALPRLTIPVLYLQSREDNRISVSAAERAFTSIGARDKTQQWLTGCGHIISADFCRDVVADRVIAWFAAHRPSRGTTASARVPAGVPPARD